ncbi:MAG: hypothetical protein IH984_05300 [Planctomycetes bacterium]|nr:hypothetical protein [Planctomycetota bacterium]
MKSNRLNNRLFCAAAVCAVTTIVLSPSVNADTLRVDGRNGSTSGNGSGWGSNAYKYLWNALEDSDPGDEVWVAAGTYYVDQNNADHPDGSGDREATFLLKKGVLLRGGFAGTEMEPEDRDLIGNITILSAVLYKLPATSCGGPDEVCCDTVCNIHGYEFCCDELWDEEYCNPPAAALCGDAFHVVAAGSDIDDHDLHRKIHYSRWCRQRCWH